MCFLHYHYDFILQHNLKIFLVREQLQSGYSLKTICTNNEYCHNTILYILSKK